MEKINLTFDQFKSRNIQQVPEARIIREPSELHCRDRYAVAEQIEAEIKADKLMNDLIEFAKRTI